MNELRWILIGFGIVLLAGIYLWGRRGSAAVAEDVALRTRSEPSPQGFADARREPVHRNEDVDEPEDEAVDEERPVAEYYEVTAVRPVSPRVEARVARVATPSTDDSRPNPLPDFRRGRVEPTLGGAPVTEELPVVDSPAVVTTPAPSAPTLSSSETPSPRRPDKRKILSLRLSVAPQKIEGAKLLEALQAERLNHGKYDVFHRVHSDGQSIFSIASMVEPGTFDLEKISETQYPGVTLFAQLPGPVPGMHALNELVACARRLHQSLGGVLQDDRGVPLTVHRIERLRQEVREFERPPGAGPGPRPTSRSEGYQE